MPVAPEFLVDFVIGGTQKGGTTALWHFLSKHPEICLGTEKEAHFFDRRAAANGGPAEVARRYRAAFPERLTGTIVGEATPVYMYLPFVPKRVAQYNPAMKWVLLLRDPAERALSQYGMSRETSREWLPPGLAFRAERFRLWRDRHRTLTGRSSLRHHSYVDRGFYSRQIERIRQFFPADQLLILTAEHLRQRHAQTLDQVYAFLGVRDRTIVPAPEAIFTSRKKVPVSRRTRAWLDDRFAPEVARLESMLGRPLSEWKR